MNTVKLLNLNKFIMTRFENNKRFAMFTDEQLIELIKIHLSDLRYDGRIEEVTIDDRRNEASQTEPFSIRYKVKTTQYGWEEMGMVFNRFTMSEWDFIHICLEQNNCLPASEFLRRKNEHIVNLECSNRGYQSASKSWKEQILKIADTISA